MVHVLGTDSFIDALRPFIARRGQPEHEYSDNATNFVGAERVLRESLCKWNQTKIDGYLYQHQIQWHFNPPSASHMGGAWERIIRSVRRIMTALIQSQHPYDEGFLTLMMEIEGILNFRPLVPLTFDADNDEP